MWQDFVIKFLEAWVSFLNIKYGMKTLSEFSHLSWYFMFTDFPECNVAFKKSQKVLEFSLKFFYFRKSFFYLTSLQTFGTI